MVTVNKPASKPITEHTRVTLKLEIVGERLLGPRLNPHESLFCIFSKILQKIFAYMKNISYLCIQN